MSLLHQVPGFRSGTRWKQIVAVICYVAIASWMTRSLANVFFGAIVLLWIALIIDFGGVRRRLFLNGEDRKRVAGGWSALAVISLLAFRAVLLSAEDVDDSTSSMTELAENGDSGELGTLDDETLGRFGLDAEASITTAASVTVEPSRQLPNTQEPTEARPTATVAPTTPPTETPLPSPAAPTQTDEPEPTVPSEPVVNVVIGTANYDGDVPNSEDDEYIEIVNQGSPVNLAGWSLSDNDGTMFSFPAFEMASGQRCRVYTNEIHPESCGFNYGSTKAIWGNKGDTAYLRDPSGAVVSQKGW